MKLMPEIHTKADPREENSLDCDFMPRGKPLDIALVSGKGGVGKTSVAANLGYSLNQLGNNVLVVDADFGLGSLDVVLGISSRYDLSHVLSGEKELADIIATGPGDLHIVPAALGVEAFAQLSFKQREWLISSLALVKPRFEIVLIDTASGISSNVLHFAAMSQQVIIVLSPDPASTMSAYALIKALCSNYSCNQFAVMVNFVQYAHEARELFVRLKQIVAHLLPVTLKYSGYVLFDRKVTSAARLQRLVSELYPESEASRCFFSLARRIHESASTSMECNNEQGLVRPESIGHPVGEIND